MKSKASPTAPATSAPSRRDEELTERFRAGDERAFLEIVRGHHARVFQLVHSLLRDVHAAEEVTRGTFVQARERLSRVTCRTPLSIWLYYTALNLARQRYWSLTRPAGDGAFQPDETRVLGLQEFAALVAAHVGRIDSADQELLALRHVIGLSSGEISKVLKLRPDAVNARVKRTHDSMHPFASTSAPVESREPAPLGAALATAG